MRISVISIPLLVALALPGVILCQPGMPNMHSIEPTAAKAGQVVETRGENLGRDCVTALYLTDGTTDLKVTILEQTATSVKFRIPAEAKPGRFALMVLTKDDPPRLIQEPVKITVEPETTASVIRRIL